MSELFFHTDNLAAEAKERFGDTPAYRDFERRGTTPEMQQIIAREMMAIFGEFGDIRDYPPDA